MDLDTLTDASDTWKGLIAALKDTSRWVEQHHMCEENPYVCVWSDNKTNHLFKIDHETLYGWYQYFHPILLPEEVVKAFMDMGDRKREEYQKAGLLLLKRDYT